MVKAVASDRSLWLTSWALAGLASATANAVAARKEMDFIGSSRESPSPAPREREGPSAQRWEGEGLSAAITLTHLRAPRSGTLSRDAGEGFAPLQFQQPPRVAVQQLLRVLGGQRQRFDPFRAGRVVHERIVD